MLKTKPFSAHPHRTPRRPLRRSGVWLCLAILLAPSACDAAGPSNPADTSRAQGRSSERNLVRFEELQETIIDVSDRVKPSVVHLEAIVRKSGRRAKVTGSGILVDAEGHILTNQHIVHEAEKITVTIPGRKKKLDAKSIGTDVQTDVAVIKVKPDKTYPAPTFADSDKVRVGEWVIAIGNPYGLDGTVSFGIVSAKGRNLNVPDLINEFIQTDAMIDRGSSGGPLLNLRGEVIGVNSRGQGRGIGFTIPINTALNVKDAIVASGTIERGYLGVSIQPLDRELAEYFNLSETSGVIINSVRAGSPAKNAGLQPGDILTHFEGKPVEAEEDKELSKFQRVVAQTEVGKSVELAVIRDHKPITLTAVIGRQPKVQAEEEEFRDIGINVKEITQSIYIENRLDTKEGVIVSHVENGTPAAEANIFVGDVIQELDRKVVKDLSDFKRAMAGTQNVRRFLVKARRGKDLKFLLVKMDRGTGTPASPEGSQTSESGKAPPM
jgi:Do/DeqQ family serine protease